MRRTLKHYFIPHEGNQYRPHFFREASLATLLSLALILFISSLAYGIVATKTNYLASIYPSVVVNLTNENRVSVGDLPLQVNPLLEKVATLKAQDMSEKGYFAHVSPEGLTPWHWFDVAGYAYLYAGENLAVNFTDTDTVVDAWMNSPLHRGNILSTNFTEIGIATSHGVYKGRNTIFVVQDFGTPVLAASPEEADDGEATTTAAESSVVSMKDSSAVKNLAAIAPATVLNGNSLSHVSWFEKLVIAYPSLVTDAYMVLAGIVTLSLVLLIFIEVKKQHPKNILYGFLLLILVLALLYFSRAILFPQVIIL